MPERKFLDIRLVFQENSHPEIRKTYFLAPKWGVDLYMGLTYTQVNTVHVLALNNYLMCYKVHI